MMDRDRATPDSERRRRSMGRDSRADSGGRRVEEPDFGMAAKEAERQRSMNMDRPEPGQIVYDNKPVGFRTLAISNWNNNVSDMEIEEALFQNCGKIGDFNIKVINNGDFRVAYMNFKFPEDAMEAKRHLSDFVVYDRTLRADPVYSQKRGRSMSPDGFRHNKFQRGGGGGGGGGRNFNRGISPGSHMGRGGPMKNRQEPMNRDNYNSPGFDNNRRNSGGREGGGGFQNEPKFPYHLDHVPPEDDIHATRTLFVGNLDLETDPEELKNTFTRFGMVEDVDVKRPAKGQGNAYAFVRFLNLDMSHDAKVRMSGKFIGRYQCKIGYGKAQATNCLWIGGLGPWVRGETLEREFDRFGVIHRIEWPQGKNFAYVLYDNVDAATAACQEMRGFPLGGPDRRLRVDFSDPNHLQMTFDEVPIPRPINYDQLRAGGGDNNYQENNYREPEPRRDRDEGNRGYNNDWGNNNRNNYNEPPSRGRGGGGGGGRDNWNQRGRNNYDDRNDSFNRDRQDYGGRGENDRNSYPPRNGGGRYNNQGYQNNYNDRRGGGDFRDQGMERTNGRQQYTRDFSPPKRRRSPDNDFQNRSDHNRQRSENREANNHRNSAAHDYMPNISHVDNLLDLAAQIPCVWSGALVLKNSAFAAKMHLLVGDVNIVDTLMRDRTSTEMPLLKIMQRLRLDQPKLDEVGRRVASTPHHAVLVAMPGSVQTVEESNPNMQQRPLRNLVSYLKQKEAAGVITLPPVSGSKKPVEAGVLHAFPPCQFGHNFLAKRAPKLGPEPVKEDHLIIVVVKNDS